MRKLLTSPVLLCLAALLIVVHADTSSAASADESAARFAVAPEVLLDVRYDAEFRTIEGAVDVRFIPESPTVYFSLLANLETESNPYIGPRQEDFTYPFGFEPARTTILSVEFVSEADPEELPYRYLAMPPSWQTYSLDDTVLAVDLPSPLTDQSITIRCRFITEAPRLSTGDQGVTDNILTWRFGWFPMLFPEQAQIVESEGVVGYEHKESLPLVFPWTSLSGTVTVPAEYQLIAGTDSIKEIGLPEDEQVIGESEDTPRRYEVRNSTPSRSLAITIGKDYSSYRIDSTIDVEVFYLSRYEADARHIATLALDILDSYVSLYGSYPRSSLTIVQNPSTDGHAFAADGIVWLSSRFFTHRDVLFPRALDRIIEYVLAHEIAHQWVGLGTGIDLDAEAWLSEGLAQYLSVRYFESRYGSFEPNMFAPQVPGIVGNVVEQQWGFLNLREHFVELPYLLSTQAGFDEELIKATENVQFGNAESVRLYDKGYLVARAIGAKIGVEAFEQALTQAIQKKQADLLDARSFQHLLEETSGQSLSDFFDFWVFGPGNADYSIRILSRTVEDGTHTTLVAASRDGGVAQPVTVEATMQSEGTAQLEWDGVDESAILEFTTPTFVASVSIDPEHNIPDRDRLNNHAPAKIVGAVNKNVLPLDAYVLAPDQETGGIIFSHLDRLRIMVSQASASAVIKLERNHEIGIDASFATLQPTGQITYTYTAYEQPMTGSAATYWEPSTAFSVACERFVADGGPFFAVTFQIADLPSIAGAESVTARLRLAPRNVQQVEIAAHRETRLLPGVYLVGDARVGLSNRAVPEPLQFRSSELHCSPLSQVNDIAEVRGAIELPSIDSLPYSLFHLAMIDGVRSRLFVTAGVGWTSPDEFGTTSPNIEAGMEQIIELSTLGGLLSLSAKIGLATPVLGDGITTLYGSISF